MTRTLLIALSLALAGCAVLDPQAGQSRRVDETLSGVLRACQSPPAAQRRELSAARQAFAAHGGDLERLRLAAMLATLPAPLGDDARASALLKPLVARRADTASGRLAALLETQLAERRRLEQADLRQRRALRESERRAQDLRRKLSELQAIERGALRREEKLRIE